MSTTITHRVTVFVVGLLLLMALAAAAAIQRHHPTTQAPADRSTVQDRGGQRPMFT